MKKIKTVKELSEQTGLSPTIIKSLIVDYDIPSVQIGSNKDSLILINEEEFKKVFTNINVGLKIRTLERRRKNKEKSKVWYQENKKQELEKSAKRCDENYNTFGRRTKHTRGKGSILKRDYELTEEELRRRNNKRETRKNRSGEKRKGHSVLIRYDGKLNDLSGSEYSKELSKEQKRQKRCAILGTIGKVRPSEHFLFDFDLEQMLKDKAYVTSGNRKIYITKWWEGTIRHWTVNDGVWKKENKNNDN